MKRGVLVLGYPILDVGGILYLGDTCYQQTIELCRLVLDEVVLVARRRALNKMVMGLIRLDDVGVPLVLELPDFGAGGRAGWLNTWQFFAPSTRASMCRLFQGADLIYTAAIALEGYLTAVAAQRVGRSLVIEMRNEVLLNRRYMAQRFGPKGIVYAWIFGRQFRTIRRQAIAGLYLNRSLMQRYPVAGEHQQAISDVQLPDEIFGQPKTYTAPARRFLYVGHLEKVKRVDLILRALHRVKDELPQGWTLDVVGDGPGMPTLRRLAKDLGIESHVRFHGRVPWGETLFDFYKRADWLLVASTTETGPRTMLESMALGTPVFSTSVGLAPDVLDQRVLAPEGNVVEYSQRLLAVANDPALMTYLSNQNRQRVQDFHLSKLRAKRTAFFARAIEISSRGF